MDRDATYTDADGVEQTRTVTPGFVLAIDGSMNILNLLVLEGDFDASYKGGQLVIQAIASAQVLVFDVREPRGLHRGRDWRCRGTARNLQSEFIAL